MKKKILWISSFLLIFLPVIISPTIIKALSINTFQVTTDGSQQKDAFVYKELIAYDSLGDIWGYNLEKKENFPIIQKGGEQYITDLSENLLVYQDIPPNSGKGDIRIYNIKTGKDSLIIGEPNSYSSGGTNGDYVIYLDGGACGNLYAYHIRRNKTEHIADTVCTPKITDNIVYWGENKSGNLAIKGYNLNSKKYIDILDDVGNADIFDNNVVWYEYSGNYQVLKVKNLKTGRTKIIYETTTSTLQAPSLSNKFVVWSESPSVHVNSVKAADLKTGEVFVLQEPGQHQNSHTATSIWRDTAAWMSWRTGNGDIYASIIDK